MKNSSNQDARRRTYVDTFKTGNAEWADFSCLPFGLKPKGAACCVGNAHKVLTLFALAALRSAPFGLNALPFYRVNRPYLNERRNSDPKTAPAPLL